MKYDDLFVCKFPKSLSKEEIFTLYDRMKQGDMEAREKLINHNIGLVVYCVRTDFKDTNYDKKELVSVGCFGLIKAVDTYDISKGREFSTYAGRCIINEINYFLRSLKKNSKVSNFDDVISVDKDGNDLKLEDVVPSKVDIERDYVENEYNNYELQLLQQSMECLNERDRKIVMLYFGFYNNKRYGQREIADMFGISRSQTSRIINCSLKKIRAKMESFGNLDKNVSDNTLKRSKNN